MDTEKQHWINLASPDGVEGAESSDPIALLSQMGLAALAGLSRQRIGQLYHEGRLPIPYATVDDQPAWLISQFGSLATRESLGATLEYVSGEPT
jgi:hypothetical protein